MCKTCGNTGFLMQDIGTATIPDFVEIRCKCNPEPTDEDAANWLDEPAFVIEQESVLYVPKDAEYPWFDTRAGYPAETEYPHFDVPVVDYDPVLPSGLLA